MPTQNINKIIYGSTVLIDLTSDTVVANKLLSGFTAHDASGAIITGTCTFDANTQDANATASEILNTKTAYVRGSKVTGTMPNNGAVTGTISTVGGEYAIPMGFHDGSGKVSISSTEAAKLVAENIRDGVTILGVTGTMSGSEDVKPQQKIVTPTIVGFEVSPDSPTYNYLTSVTINAIPYTEVENSAGGLTVTIAGAA